MGHALIGLIGVLIGIALTEHFRRKSRIENYSSPVFEKRLMLYEELFDKVNQCYSVAGEVLEDSGLTKEERHNLISGAVHDIAEFCDNNGLYFDEAVTVHCVSLVMGVEDIPDISDEKERERAEKTFRNNFVAAKKMIRKEAGVTDLNKLFRSMIKPKHSSPVIEYYRKLRNSNGTESK